MAIMESRFYLGNPAIFNGYDSGKIKGYIIGIKFYPSKILYDLAVPVTVDGKEYFTTIRNLDATFMESWFGESSREISDLEYLNE